MSQKDEHREEVCFHCGASMRAWWHRLTPGVVNALWKFAKAVGRNGRNEIHLLHDMTGDLKLTRHEWNNFTVLRFFGLAVHVKDRRGYWLLTRRGAQFLKGKLAVPRRVQTFRNEVVGHDEQTVTMPEFWKLRDPEWFEQQFDYEIAEGNVLHRPPKQASML